MALASQLVNAGLTHQQVADVVTAFRLKHGNPKGKGYRRDYLQRTIYTASQTECQGVAEVNIGTECQRPAQNLVKARNSGGLPELSQEEAGARLYELLAEAQDTGTAGRLFDASCLLATISDGQFSDFIGAVKKAVADSKAGLNVDLNLLKRARRLAVQGLRRSSAAQQSASSSQKPVILISNKQLSELRTEAVNALQDSNDPQVIFQRLRELVRFRRDATNEPFLEAFDEKSLRGRLADVALFYAESDNGGMVSVFPPRALCEDILAYDLERRKWSRLF